MADCGGGARPATETRSKPWRGRLQGGWSSRSSHPAAAAAAAAAAARNGLVHGWPLCASCALLLVPNEKSGFAVGKRTKNVPKSCWSPHLTTLTLCLMHSGWNLRGFVAS
jgi:hypothetical protein